MTTIGEQLDLAGGGWRDAWRHELRGPHGEWVSGGVTPTPEPLAADMPGSHGPMRMAPDGLPDPSPESLALARKMIQPGGVTPAQRELTARMLGGNLDLIPPQMRTAMAATHKVRVLPQKNLGEGVLGVTGAFHGSWEIHITKNVFTKTGDQNAARDEYAGFSILTGGTEHSALRHTVTHEFGHALFELSQIESGAIYTVPGEDDAKMTPAAAANEKNVANDIMAGLHGPDLDNMNREPVKLDRALHALSQYGSTSPFEAMAEAYTAYALNGEGADRSTLARTAGRNFLHDAEREFAYTDAGKGMTVSLAAGEWAYTGCSGLPASPEAFRRRFGTPEAKAAIARAWDFTAPAEFATIGQQLELSWKDAWMHERRNAHGEWTRGGAGVGEQLFGFGRPKPGRTGMTAEPDKNILRQIITWDNAARYEFHNKNEANALSKATDAFQNGDMATAAQHLREAAGTEGVDGDRARVYTALADSLDPANALGPLQEVAQQFTGKAAGVVPGLISHSGTLGKAKEQWDRKVTVFPAGSRPSLFGEIGWDGTIELQDDAVKTIRDAQEHPYNAIADSSAFIVPLHELIHGTILDGEDTSGDQRAYQDPNVASIEEGFTELGTVHHAAEFFGKMGIGDHRVLDEGSEAEQQADAEREHRPFVMNTDANNTMTEWARKVDTTENINNGTAWGHYPWQTRVANQWCEEIAAEEGLKDAAAEDRARVLSDEINLHGAGHKVEALARQSYRAQGMNYDELPAKERRGLEATIRKIWNDSAKTGQNAAARARVQAQQLKEQMQERAERGERGLRRGHTRRPAGVRHPGGRVQ